MKLDIARKKKVVYEPVKLEQNYRNFDLKVLGREQITLKNIKVWKKDDKKN